MTGIPQMMGASFGDPQLAVNHVLEVLPLHGSSSGHSSCVFRPKKVSGLGSFSTSDACAMARAPSCPHALVLFGNFRSQVMCAIDRPIRHDGAPCYAGGSAMVSQPPKPTAEPRPVMTAGGSYFSLPRCVRRTGTGKAGRSCLSGCRVWIGSDGGRQRRPGNEALGPASAVGVADLHDA